MGNKNVLVCRVKGGGANNEAPRLNPAPKLVKKVAPPLI